MSQRENRHQKIRPKKILNLKTRFKFPPGVALVALIFYALTMSWGVTLNSLPFTASVAGWDWQPLAGRPLAWLLTLPLRGLPGGWIPAALNLFSTVTAAATLGILARSVQLRRRGRAVFFRRAATLGILASSVQRQPWDCPPDANKPWSLRLPVLLACAVCGLEFNFWQDATAMTGEMLDVFLLAAGIGCVMEFCAGENSRWLDAAAVVWGIGVIENWAMLLLLPIFLLALAAAVPGWEKINRNWRKILRTLLWRLGWLALSALVVFSIQPLAGGLMPRSSTGMDEAWRTAVQSEKFVLHTLYYNFWSWRRLLTLIVLLYFFLPMLACLMRIKNEANTHLSLTDRAQVQVFRLLRVAMLFACLWLAFDPEAGPRKIILNQFKIAMPLLTFDYLLALGAGFLLGSLLDAAQISPRRRVTTGAQNLAAFFRRKAFPLLAALSALTVAGMFMRSAAGMWFTRGTSLKNCGELLARSLPAEGGIVLANDPMLMTTLQATLAWHNDLPRWQIVNLRQLPVPKYRAWLEQKAPSGWTNATELTPDALLALLQKISKEHRIFYLQPVPGHFLFELFYPQPAGGIDELKPLPEDSFAPPAMTPQEIADNEKFWDAAWDKTLEPASRSVTSAQKWFPRRWSLTAVAPESARQAGRWFALSLNNWGVQLQRNGKLAEAKQRFEQARLLNPDNPAPQVNYAGNTNLLAGKNLDLSGTSALAKNFASVQQFARVMEDSGAFDDPAIEFWLGDSFANIGWPRQALQQLDRARKLVPDAIAPELYMARIYARYAYPKSVFQIVQHLRAYETNSPDGRALGMELSLLEAKAWLDQTNAAEANRVLESVLQKNPDDPAAWLTVFSTFLSYAPTNALTVLDRMLAKAPDNLTALNNKAAVLVQLERATEALPIFNHLLTLTNLPSIRLNRAIALLQTKDFAAAETAYHELQKTPADQFSVNYGLAQIAESRHDTNLAANYYRNCLTNCAPGSYEWRDISARLAALHPSAPAR